MDKMALAIGEKNFPQGRLSRFTDTGCLFTRLLSKT